MRQRTIFRHPAGSHRSRRVRAGARRRGEPGGRRSLRLPGRPQPGDPMPDRRQGLRPDLLRSWLPDLVLLSQPSRRSRAVRRVGGGGDHRLHRDQAQAASSAIRAAEPGQILPPRRAHRDCARTFSNRRHVFSLAGVNIFPLLCAMGLAVWFVALTIAAGLVALLVLAIVWIARTVRARRAKVDATDENA
jgi:hypothetical protein